MVRKRNPLITEDRFYKPDLRDFSPRNGEVSKVVLHCTGGRIVQLAMDHHFGTGLDTNKLNDLTCDPDKSLKVTEYSADFYHKVNSVSTGFVIGYCGERFQTLNEDVRAWSAGIGKAVISLYKKGFLMWSSFRLVDGKLVGAPNGFYDFWCKLYNEAHGRPSNAPIPNNASPLEFTGGDHGPDHIAISIDMVTPPYQRRDARGVRCLGPTAPSYENGSLYTNAQLDSVAGLLRELDSHYPKFERDRGHVLPHSLTSPIERVLGVNINGKTTGYGYDPGETLNWQRLLA